MHSDYWTGFIVGGGLVILFNIVYELIRRALRKTPGPLEFNPENLPQHAVYVHGGGDEPETCTCHGRPLRDGETVLYWPQPAKRLCKATFGQVKPS